jgi:hypothetical protein
MASVALKMKKKQWLKDFDEMKTEKDIKNTAIKTGVEAVLSVLIGGAIGSIVGRPSFIVVLATTAAGHYLGSKWLPPIGIGMMASSNPMGVGVSGFDLQGAKDRLLTFKDSILHRTYLDKVFKKGSGKTESEDETTNGIGEVNDHMETLANVHRQLVNSAMNFRRRRGESTEGIEEEVQGTEEEMQGMEETDFSGM